MTFMFIYTRLQQHHYKQYFTLKTILSKVLGRKVKISEIKLLQGNWNSEMAIFWKTQ